METPDSSWIGENESQERAENSDEEAKCPGNKNFTLGLLQRDWKTCQREMRQVIEERIPLHIMEAQLDKRKPPGKPEWLLQQKLTTSMV